MQYELKYKVIEPKRHTYQNIIDRFGDQPASLYQPGAFQAATARSQGEAARGHRPTRAWPARGKKPAR